MVMDKKGSLRRDQHLGLVVEPKMHRELKAIADSKYITLSTLCYGILKEWLKEQKR